MEKILRAIAEAYPGSEIKIRRPTQPGAFHYARVDLETPNAKLNLGLLKGALQRRELRPADITAGNQRMLHVTTGNTTFHIDPATPNRINIWGITKTSTGPRGFEIPHSVDYKLEAFPREASRPIPKPRIARVA